MSEEALKLYNMATDEYENATQDSIDQLQRTCQKLAHKYELVKKFIALNIVKDDAKLNQIAKILENN